MFLSWLGAVRFLQKLPCVCAGSLRVAALPCAGSRTTRSSRRRRTKNTHGLETQIHSGSENCLQGQCYFDLSLYICSVSIHTPCIYVVTSPVLKMHHTGLFTSVSASSIEWFAPVANFSTGNRATCVGPTHGLGFSFSQGDCTTPRNRSSWEHSGTLLASSVTSWR